MREWKSTINITDEFEAYNNDSSVSIDALGKKVAEKIRANKFFNHPARKSATTSLRSSTLTSMTCMITVTWTS